MSLFRIGELEPHSVASREMAKVFEKLCRPPAQEKVQEAI
jgi:hypothetical protein